ncbi:ADP-ribosylglycohydrolase family protein [Weissella cibaria]|uniref:ADP-ribosylglycohydrolase family protein n=1 Tax=Weissella cibaria TaxID=137591 RepID=UPI00223C2F65|nr:ADP-ribosylglycohydrolase family protein [Weissella cibaria]MCS8561002.1 ADP-ribosylglycohydrolase [Weissella cibaria]MCS8564647.1 ADP-ribosylglycohydrolase [Weissella cibaria]MCS8576741.1 ADP-ribosylglycohydrolase [Weissella cibaria]
MTLSDNPLINSTLGLINGDLFAQKIIMGDSSQWSSDSSLTLATIDSLSNGYILTDIMTQFTYWYTTGAYTADGAPQHAGDVTRMAIENFRQTQDPFTSGGRDESDNANGALLRITPVVLYLQATYGEDFIKDDPAMLTLHQVGGLTHNHPRSLIAIGLYAMLLNGLLSGMSLPAAFDFAISNSYEYYAKHAVFADELVAFEALNTPDFENMPIESLHASGYVVDTLAATIWVLLNSQNYEDALTLAAGLPGEPTRIMPLVGAVAGLMYHQAQLPTTWLNAHELTIVTRVLEKAEQSGRFACPDTHPVE